ncbi:hypothetical protein Pmani_000503 [Petrolisthes manimaculis]|uniref:Uncharacterized protein n=1 Tax=Petrolisthes manimaculis TaxID=1843537 RepID=A0AAE1QMC3_9EUCA|nr:hypothetical protein Pmani_000503 [Petrolisthes manimaculis]
MPLASPPLVSPPQRGEERRGEKGDSNSAYQLYFKDLKRDTTAGYFSHVEQNRKKGTASYSGRLEIIPFYFIL